MSQFHNSKIVLKTRTLSKDGRPVDLHCRRLLSAGMAWAFSFASRTVGLKAHGTALRSSQRKPFAIPAGVSRLSFQTVFGGLSIHAQAQSTS